MSPRFLLWARRGIAACVLALFILLYTMPPGLLPDQAAWPARLQITPAIIAGSAATLIALGIISLAFGRVYCSLLCPLGLLQDALARARKKRQFKPSRPNSLVRYGLLILFAAALALGLLLPAGLLDPYSAFGRIMNDLFAPLLGMFQGALAFCAQKLDLPFSAAREINFPGWAAWLIALLTFALILALVLKAGRMWCNYCPVGTGLGFLAQKSLLGIRIDKDKCVNCRRCEKACKTGCIDIKNHAADLSRCVACFSCASVCPKEAITYKPPSRARSVPPSALRRSMPLSILALAALGFPKTSRAADSKEINRPDIIPERRKRRPRQIPLTPPGSKSLARFQEHCTGCQLCVSACPNKVLATGSGGPGPLQPGMTFEYGYCRPNCARCGEVCPAGAIEPVSLSDKKKIQIGLASVDFKRCIVHADHVQCTACQRVCPSEAISLVPLSDEPHSLRRPEVSADKCIGCGACEYICPAQPLAAIAVSANETHKPV